MTKRILLYGLIAGLIVSVMLLVTFSSSFLPVEYGEVFGYSSMVIAFATIFVAVKSHRDKELGGSITFGKSFKIGLGITIVASVLYVFCWMIMSETVAKNFMDQYYEQTILELKESGLSVTELEEQLQEAAYFKELYKNPFFKMGITFLEIFPIGLVFSLLSAAILKKKKASLVD